MSSADGPALSGGNIVVQMVMQRQRCHPSAAKGTAGA